LVNLAKHHRAVRHRLLVAPRFFAAASGRTAIAENNSPENLPPIAAAGRGNVEIVRLAMAAGADTKSRIQ
jgi:hypothetical protein